MMSVSSKTNRKFIVIIEEWDAFFREAKNDEELQKEYVQLLCGLFKGGIATEETIAAAYMTGILPIKKYGTESALTDFKEYTMTRPGRLAEYVVFTETEVKRLCDDLIHLGYLAYDADKREVYIPNLEVAEAFEDAVSGNEWGAVGEALADSDRLLEATIGGNADAVAEALERIHGSVSSVLNYTTRRHLVVR